MMFLLCFSLYLFFLLFHKQKPDFEYPAEVQREDVLDINGDIQLLLDFDMAYRVEHGGDFFEPTPFT